ncbi:MAG: LCP family protein [Thermoleophilaceae bacterium]|nr:LCP family protein [Thermoleophilaceae bacterium]
MGERPPEYKVYRSRRGLLDRFRSADEPSGLRELRKLRQGGGAEPGGPDRPRRRLRGRVSLGKALKVLALLAVGWILLAVVLFFVSAQTTEGSDARTERALNSGGSLFTGSTILVLGSDARPEDSKEPGAGGPSRADSILLLHVGFGSVRRLSILRDSLAEIPGHGEGKINSAYAIGGAPLMIRTVRGFMGNGLRINHVIEVNFTEFPELIDSLGGIDVKLKRCVSADPFSGRRFKLPKGEHHLNGRQALAFARVRKNKCSPGEDDRARARRQQQVLSSIRSRALSPHGFFRAPWIAWEAPRTIKSDLKGFGMAGLFTDLLTGGSGKTRVLLPSGESGGALTVSEGEKVRTVRALEGEQ